MEKDIEKLVYKLVFENDKEAAEEIRKRVERQGIKLASTYNLYKARAKNEWEGFSVPAFNIRTLTFDTARAIFRQVLKKKVGAFIFELARSEIGYTDQTMAEYVLVILAAALEEGFRGPLFFQGDHFQIKAEKFFAPQKREEEIGVLKKLIKDSIESGVYNIDIDSSTLVRLEEKDLLEQQKFNYQLTAELTAYTRSLQPSDITISVGGEVGEIGGKNSTSEDLKIFMEGCNKELAKIKAKPGLIKMAVQTGTTHGGIVGPKGELMRVDIDFKTLSELSDEARKYGMAGAVQHGASTLPEEYFDEFPKTGAIEIHLATAFQNIVYDYMPAFLKEKIYSWLKKEMIKEMKPGQTKQQFLYETRKKALGPFKKEIWGIPQKDKDKISEELGKKFAVMFGKLGVENTVDLINKYYS